MSVNPMQVVNEIVQSTLTNPQERALWTQWCERVASGTLSEGVSARTLRVMGKSGDTPVLLPAIVSLDALQAASPEERFVAMELGARLVTAFQARNRNVILMGDGGKGEIVQRFDPTQAGELLILSAIAGG